MVNRPAGAAEPDDSSHVEALEAAGATTFRGEGRIAARGVVEVTGPTGTTTIEGRERRRRGRLDVQGAADRRPRRDPALDQLRGDARPASCRGACSSSAAARPAASSPRSSRGSASRRRSSSPGRGSSRPSIRATPRSIRFALERDGARSGPACVRSGRAPGPATDGAHVVDLDDGSTVEGHAILLAVGRDVPGPRPRHGALRRSRSPGRTPTRATAGSGSPTACGSRATRRDRSSTPTRATTRASWPCGWRWARRSCPTTARCPGRRTWTRSRRRSGVTLDQARDAGLDAFECVADFTKSAKGYSVEAETGHVTIVVDRATRELVGAAMACPDASAAIHECVRRDPRAGQGRRPRGDDPRVPDHVADLQRAVRGGAGEARQRRLATRDRQPSPAADPVARRSAAGDDRAVDEHQPRPRVPQGPADLDGLVDRRGREHDDVGAVARQQPATVAPRRR